MFEYSEAFSRNLGWFTENEQAFLKSKKIAIAGMGGVGGIYLLSCVRLGIENFHISDFDIFELGNFNRQIGSMTSTIGKSKSRSMIDMAKDINPNIKITSFDEGINESNISDFLKGCDFYLDGMDLFEMDVRRLIFKNCQESNIPFTTHAPLGMGTAYMTFDQNSPDFDSFFDFDNYPKELHPLLFVIGLAPSGCHMSYLMDLSRINFQNKKVSSTFMGCLLCAGTAVTEMSKYLLNRGNVDSCPSGYHFDAYSKTYTKHSIKKGNKSFLQKIKIAIIQKRLNRSNSMTYPYGRPDFINALQTTEDIKNILDLTRWAPNGHNEQLFDLMSTKAENIIIFSVKNNFIPVTTDEIESLKKLHAGIYAECMRIAATRYGYSVSITPTAPDTYEAVFSKDNIEPSPLADFIRGRFTDRRSYKKDKIDHFILNKIQQSLDPGYTIEAWESVSDKKKFYKLESLAFDIQMTNKDIFFSLGLKIDLANTFSDNNISFDSLNLPSLIKWQLGKLIKTPKLMFFLNKIGSHKILNYLYVRRNAVNCGAYISMKSNVDKGGEFQDGQNIARLWLLLTQYGIHLQPAYLIKSLLSKKIKATEKELDSFENLTDQLGLSSLKESKFIARIGLPIDHRVYSRSTRVSRQYTQTI